MKKLVAVLLTFVLLLGCGVTSVSAESSKLLPDLQKAMTEKTPNDEIGVYISYKVPVVTVADMPSWPDIYTARREYFAFSGQKQAEIQAEIFEGIDVRVTFQSLHNMVLAYVKVSDIEKIASYDIVRDINYFDDTIIEISEDEPADPEPFSHTHELWESGATLTANDIEDAVNDLLKNPKHIPADDITICNAYRFNSAPAYIVDYEVKGYGIYLTVILEEKLGDYLFYSDSSYEPEIFIENKLYTLTQAYEAGLLTDEMLRELVEADYKCGSNSSRCRLITPYIKGDADGDGEVNVIDATYIQRYDIELIGAMDLYKPLADVDGDGDVNVIDATRVQRYDLGLQSL